MSSSAKSALSTFSSYSACIGFLILTCLHGTKIAFNSYRDGNGAEIYVMNADGTGQTRLTNNNAQVDSYPDWSPDGTKIAFYTDRDGGNDEIYVMNADGSNPTRLTNNPDTDAYPDWSPDGTKIAFFSGNDIYIMNADGSGETNISNNPYTDLDADWVLHRLLHLIQPYLSLPSLQTLQKKQRVQMVQQFHLKCLHKMLKTDL
jgi:dipeptidyl aminopeptidase/acylaminoacyl peptidase